MDEETIVEKIKNANWRQGDIVDGHNTDLIKESRDFVQQKIR
jgi:hypothetical protein